MFSLFKRDPTKKLREQYNDKLERAMQAQRNGDISAYSFIHAEAEDLWREIERIESNAK
ncbi:DUF6435 family protein [Enterovibrio makurazakiensis]|uniref:DUF6435 family protein n=1 Tax=Enterovibrio gelatinilyticus TaxID=2899819 RepID=A0ABT5QZ42_9GAMM|nr:DUF6435 family protein [Enterovibrio sp. ZSDZ42]MDD1793034.1 DUF6435 family protein [Enterovibrio sp. ZSDZ42]